MQATEQFASEYGLTAEQLGIRETGIGASEIAAVAGLNPFASPIDVWLVKPGPNRPAMKVDQDLFGPADVGNVLEPGVLELYSRRTGHKAVRKRQTLRHPEHPWVLASPDAEVSSEHLVEIKVVGVRMMPHWEDGPPDYVYTQGLWQLAVTGAHVVDVVALLGTDLRIFPIARNDELIADLIEIGRAFWFGHVLTDIPPDPQPDEDRVEYLRKRYYQKSADLRPIPEDQIEEVEALRVSERQHAQDLEKIKGQLEGLRAKLMERIGHGGGLLFPDGGRYTWKAPEGGSISYKGIAEELAPFGIIPPELLAKHSSPPTRRFAYCPPKKKGSR